jgi:hypothetical protein
MWTIFDVDNIQYMEYPQGHHEYLYQVFGFDEKTSSTSEQTRVTQDLGSISTHEGRLLTFLNTLQHRVSPFSLADKPSPAIADPRAFSGRSKPTNNLIGKCASAG